MLAIYVYSFIDPERGVFVEIFHEATKRSMSDAVGDDTLASALSHCELPCAYLNKIKQVSKCVVNLSENEINEEQIVVIRLQQLIKYTAIR